MLQQNQNNEAMKKPEEKSEILQAYKPLFMIMLFYGLDIAKKDNSRFRKFCTGTVHIMVVVFHVWFGYMCFDEIDRNSLGTATGAYYTTISMLSFEVAFVHVLFLRRRLKFAEVVQQLDESCREILGNRPTTYRMMRWIYLTVAVFCVVTFPYIIKQAIDLNEDYQHDDIYDNDIDKGHDDDDDYDDLDYDDMNGTFKEETEILQKDMFDQLFYILPIVSSILLSMFIIFFVTVLLFIRKCFKKLAELKDLDRGKWPASTTYLRRHDMLCSLIRVTDEAFSEILLSWNLSELTALIFYLRSMDIGGEYMQDIYIEDVATALLFLALFIIKSVCAASINDKVLESIEHLTDVQEAWFTSETAFAYGEELQMTETKLQETKCRMYVRYVQVDKPRITGWGVYKIHNGFLWMATANVITYILVLYNAK